jgi:hypothetical protein
MRVIESEFTGVAINPNIGLRRLPPRGVRNIDPKFWDRYDSETLFYCSIFDPASHKLSFFGPPLLNLREFVLNAHFTTEAGERLRPRVIRLGRLDRIDFQCFRSPGKVRFSNGQFTAHIDVDERDINVFSNLNVLYTMSQNNSLRWIQDWMIWHQKRHGANAIILADNASSAYTIDELKDAISSVRGYKVAAIVSVPFKYGPDNLSAIKAGYGEFLQVAIMNALWYRWMSGARAVLNVDIDEIVTSPDQKSIFDAAVAAPFGIVMCKGRWRYAMTMGSSTEARHQDHFLMRPDDDICPPKYCIRPGSFAAKRTLKVHGVSNFKRMPFISREKFTFYHCRNISTSWKYERNGITQGNLKADEITLADLRTIF